MSSCGWQKGHCLKWEVWTFPKESLKTGSSPEPESSASSKDTASILRYVEETGFGGCVCACVCVTFQMPLCLPMGFLPLPPCLQACVHIASRVTVLGKKKKSAVQNSPMASHCLKMELKFLSRPARPSVGCPLPLPSLSLSLPHPPLDSLGGLHRVPRSSCLEPWLSSFHGAGCFSSLSHQVQCQFLGEAISAQPAKVDTQVLLIIIPCSKDLSSCGLTCTLPLLPHWNVTFLKTGA